MLRLNEDRNAGKNRLLMRHARDRMHEVLAKAI